MLGHIFYTLDKLIAMISVVIMLKIIVSLGVVFGLGVLPWLEKYKIAIPESMARWTQHFSSVLLLFFVNEQLVKLIHAGMLSLPEVLSLPCYQRKKLENPVVSQLMLNGTLPKNKALQANPDNLENSQIKGLIQEGRVSKETALIGTLAYTLMVNTTIE
ncbi:hypothetical protein [Candidatus Synchoanobacter obligatus]|uniref:Uncharacterized protein n=1 Tax=Candidatus Synchoanobacter obligatus TaxID=2919597 RepID=A0ABT1L4B6_9GAMM|nr:hypothetical protein [Candidatus Synchoanobacter obligatus]MCP8352015.1 hypothetical protein [Candidatus Synchoanobacter obligatus]